MDSSVLIAALQALSDAELVEVLKAVFVGRQPNPEEARYNHNGFFLGTFARLAEEDDHGMLIWDSSWRIQAVAYIDRQRYPTGGPDWGLCQFGECHTCGMAVRSNGKQGSCPICATSVSMT